MTKAVICLRCADLVAPYSPYRDGRWRWCECDTTGVRWRDATAGLLEVTSRTGPDHLRVLGVNNLFLRAAVTANPWSADGSRTFEQWRTLHQLACTQVGTNYLFHKDKRDCWALIVRVGETGDVFYMDYADAKADAKAETDWARYERGARCVAHGTERCERCHRNPSTCATADGRCSGCVVYAETGMHWDTCPNRTG